MSSIAPARLAVPSWRRKLPPLLLAGSLVLLVALLSEWIALPVAQRRWTAAAVTVMAYAAFCGWVAMRRLGLGDTTAGADSQGVGKPLLIAHASQTGFAEQLAVQTAEVLRSAGMAARVLPLGRLRLDDLLSAEQALFVVSTTGEGDAPDSAAGFARRVMGEAASLGGLEYGVLALGDSSYARYCAFGHAVDGWLHRHGARQMFDPVMVDDGDEGALRHWQHHLGVLSGNTEMADWSAPRYGRWRLVERRLLNPGSPGGPAFHLGLVCVDGAPAWQAGDIAEIGPRNGAADVAHCLARAGLDGMAAVVVDGASLPLAEALARRVLPHDEAALSAWRGRAPQEAVDTLRPLPHREYSIASLPSDGRLELLVRQMRYPDGRLGLGSGWLTAHALPGDEIALRIRSNTSFHQPDADVPLILIGNGTGLAGLRAHLRARAAAGRHRNWLLFGERTRAHDYLHGDEIDGWLRDGVLARADLAFSRDGGAVRYVQHGVAQAAGTLREWVDEGAAIYVCGSLQGMAAGVAEALEAALGRETLERLTEDGRYRRDVY